MTYAKLIDGHIQYAPRKIKDGETVIYNPPAEMLMAEGYLPIRMTSQPEVEDGYMAEMGWEQTGNEIVQTWTIVVDPYWNETEAEEILSILTGGAE